MATSLPAAAVPLPSHHAKPFHQLVNNVVCSCGRDGCRTLLRDYYLDPASPYPDPARPQLIFAVNNPAKQPDTRKKGLSARRQQVFDRAAKLLGVDKSSSLESRKKLYIAIHHFPREVVNAFASDSDSGRCFLDYLLPQSLVRGGRLGATFTSVDRFVCIGTDAESKGCRAALDAQRSDGGGVTSLKKACTCNRYMNVPVVTGSHAALAEEDKIDAFLRVRNEAYVNEADVVPVLSVSEAGIVDDEPPHGSEIEEVEEGSATASAANEEMEEGSATASAANEEVEEGSATPSAATVEAKKLRNVRCDCRTGDECRALLKEYCRDGTASYPPSGNNNPDCDGRPLVVKLSNPRRKNPNSNRVRQSAQRQRLYDRAARILGVEHPDNRSQICVGVHHFKREVIEHYLANPRRARTVWRREVDVRFVDYPLPAEFVRDRRGGPTLGWEFTDEDRFDCVGTLFEKKSCRKNERCSCGLFMNVPFLSAERARKDLGKRVVIHFANFREEPVARQVEFINDVRVTKKVCVSCQNIKSKEGYDNKEWAKAAGTGECSECQKARRRVPDGMALFEVTVPQGVEPNEKFSISVNGKSLTLKCPLTAKEGMKVRFYLPRGALDASKVELRLCWKCNTSMPQGGFSVSQWSKPSGKGQCTVCYREGVKQFVAAPSEQIKNLVADNLQWRKQCELLREERDKMEARVKELEEKMGIWERTEGPNAPFPVWGEDETQWLGGQRVKLMSDGTFVPTDPPELMSDGRYARPKGTHRLPKVRPMAGYRWCPVYGVWAPVSSKRGPDGQYAHPDDGKNPKGFEWDCNEGVWRCAEGPDQKRQRRCMINPDCSMTPASAPKLLEDGTYARQKGGRTPKGYEWDANRGLWVPTSLRRKGSGESVDVEEDVEDDLVVEEDDS